MKKKMIEIPLGDNKHKIFLWYVKWCHLVRWDREYVKKNELLNIPEISISG